MRNFYVSFANYISVVHLIVVVIYTSIAIDWIRIDFYNGISIGDILIYILDCYFYQWNKM